jgi:protein TonB
MAPAREDQMFNNLIESSSHARDFKRRGRFVLFTMVAYGLLFVGAGVASIYAYDAHLDEESTEQIVTMVPMIPADQPKVVIHDIQTGGRKPSGPAIVPERMVAMASVNQPTVPPTAVSTHPNPNLPVPDSGIYTITGRDRVGAPGGPDGDKPSVGNVPGPTAVAITDVPPPPVVIQKPVPQILHKQVINGEAVELPKPPYPPLAKINRTQGVVNVQVLIDENGKVISAHAVLGSPLLAQAAVAAALRARFSPTKIGDQPVKVSGVITYNFVLQ